MGTEGLNCFVCDAAAVGRYFTLATCRTQASKVRIIEKLGQLVGDKYMVVISNDDIICRGCASMMNTLDRLEKEMNSLRSVVLRYLEKKYELEEDELSKELTPQIKNNTRLTGSKKSVGMNDIAGRKRKAAGMDGDVEEWSDKEKKEGKANTWLQCDKCKYTTLYNSFMVHHVRKHNSNESTKKGADVDVGGGKDMGGGTEVVVTAGDKSLVDKEQNSQAMVSLQSKMMEMIESQKIGDESVTESQEAIAVPTNAAQKDEALSDTSETVEMIAAEINDFTSDQRVIMAANAGTSAQVESVQEDAAASTEHVTLQVAPGEDSIDASSTICMVDENGMIVQKMEQAEDGTLYVQVMDNPDSTKQVLSVAEDGSVQMVEVMWDEMVNPEAVEDDNMSF